MSAALAHVSVLLPVYNGEALLPGAVESILAQTYDDWDLVVIDDGSTDGTDALLRAYAVDPRVCVVRMPENSGMGAALAAGLTRAEGPLVARMDADDESDPDRLRLQCTYLAEHPEVDVVGCGALLVDEEGRDVGTYLPQEHHEQIVADIFRRSPFVDVSVVMRRRFLEDSGGYDRRFRRAVENDLWLRSYGRATFHNLQVPLVRVRLGRNQRLRSTLFGTYALARAAWRERRPLTRGWYAPRYLLGALAAHLGLRKSSLERITDRS